MTLPQIIEMVEKASGPDRALDFEIANALGIFCDSTQSYLARDYTHSIDSALTLIPEGMSWRLERDGNWYRASVLVKAHTAYRSPAIAICATALRARLQSQKESDAPSPEVKS